MKLSIRILVKLSLIVIVLLGSFSMAQAQKQKKIYNRPHCKVFLKNGKVVDSYLMAGHNLIHRTDSAIKLSNNPNAFFPKTEKYYNEEVEKMISKALESFEIICKKPREKDILLKVIK